MNDGNDFTPCDDRNLDFNNNGKSDAEDAFENCYLYDVLRDYADDSLVLCQAMRDEWTLAQENNYLRELWEWERSAIKPIREWLNPSPKFVDPKTASDQEVSVALRDLCAQLRKIHQKLEHIDHLSDRRLYQLLISDVLPCPVKYLPHGNSTCWDFCSFPDEERVERYYDFNWLTYYANDEERTDWRRSDGRELPPKMVPPYKRESFPFR